jgi:ElaB/YqjD/DUF883 family membrane-anchored ribosome-binding protein
MNPICRFFRRQRSMARELRYEGYKTIPCNHLEKRVADLAGQLEQLTQQWASSHGSEAVALWKRYEALSDELEDAKNALNDKKLQAAFTKQQQAAKPPLVSAIEEAARLDTAILERCINSLQCEMPRWEARGLKSYVPQYEKLAAFSEELRRRKENVS